MVERTTFNYNDMLNSLDAYMQRVQKQIKDLQSKATDTGATLDPGAMFLLQIAMQTASQFMETCSAVMTAIHSSMMTMARAAKGGG